MNAFRLGKDKCELCADHSQNDITHILFDCRFLDDIRNAQWQNVIDKCPSALSDSINVMSSKEKCSLLLSGLNCEFICEWYEMYSAILDFVYQVYMSYYRIRYMS